ncbi:condensation domain-containing protein [Stieleria varia]|uniref:Phthiocerol/phthiodiolone dimycocerosyl transferase n=1 Tax=Stieleria varia TaxID=2528005 RepID=A0A5C6A3H2_9BACT|nr:condensation domain-containing protein [Stieleria varia]TWT94454.1 Chondramide synthase cmdD [Stieleria varia]
MTQRDSEETMHDAVFSGRPLSPFENVFWRLTSYAQICVSAIAHVQGTISETLLRNALDLVRDRHPLLRVRIETTNDGPAFRTDNVPEIPLRVVQCDSEQWTAVVEEEINTPFPLDIGPLFRCVLADHGNDESHLLITFDHVVGDGMSGMYLLRDLLQHIQTPQSDGFGPVKQRLADTTAMDERLPAAVLGGAGSLRRAKLVAGVVFENLRYGAVSPIPMDQQAALNQRHTKVISQEFDESFVASLAKRSRQEQTTVHGALSAAIVLGVVHDAGKSLSIKHRCPVNVRDSLVPAVGEDVGMFASMVLFRGRVDPGEPFWDLARRIRGQLKSSIDRGQPAVMASMLPRLYQTIGGDKLPLETLAERWQRHTRSTSGLTNVGRLDLSIGDGPLQLRALTFAVSPGAIGDFACTAATYADRMLLNFMCPEPTINEFRGVRLADDIAGRLRAAVR